MLPISRYSILIFNRSETEYPIMSDTLQIQAQNIKCGGCVAAIETGLTPLPGISRVEVSIDTGMVRVEGDGLDEQAIRDKLAELGYPAA